MMLKRLALRRIAYAFLLLRRGGVRPFLRYAWSWVYSRASYIWLVKDLNSAHSSIPPKIPYSLQLASLGTFETLLDNLNGERGAAVLEVLRRVSFYKRGFDTCYIALTDSGELCYMEWLLSPRQNNLIRANFPHWMRELKEGEVMLENAFTFPRYRGKGIMTSVMFDLAEIARSQGFSRMLIQVEKGNEAALKGCYRLGFRAFAEDREVRLLFRARRQKGGITAN